MCVIPLSPMVYIIHGLTHKDSKSLGETRKNQKNQRVLPKSIAKPSRKQKKTKKTKDLSNYGGGVWLGVGAHVWASLSLIIACFLYVPTTDTNKHAIIREGLAQT